MTGDDGMYRRGLRFLRERWRVVVRLGGWSVLETGQTFLTGYAPARALDEGFLAGRPNVGLAWLGVAGLGVLVGAYGTVRVYAAVAALVEPLRDRLVTRVVARGVREGDAGALSGLTQQAEIARDTFAGLVMVSRSFVFTAAGALVGLFSLAPLLLVVVGLPLLAGVALFVATLRPLARRQEAFLVADEALAERLGAVCPGLRDITAAGAEDRVASDTGDLVDAEQRAASSLARWGVLRVASLAIGGQFPIVLLLAAAPWLLRHGVTTGALVGALSYVTQSLLPALRNLVHGLGTSGSRLAVVVRRLVREEEPPPDATAGEATRAADEPYEFRQKRPGSPTRRPPPTPEDSTRPRPPTTEDSTQPRPATTEDSTQHRPRTTEDTTQRHPRTTEDTTQRHPRTTEDTTQQRPPTTEDTTQQRPPTTEDTTQRHPRTTEDTTQQRPPTTEDTTQCRPPTTEDSTQQRPRTTEDSTQQRPRTVSGPAECAVPDEGPRPAADRPGQWPTPPGARPSGPPPDTPALSLTSVTFAYGPAAAPVLKDLDLTLAPGAHLAVVGPSGIGKSTLTALVAGLLRPGRGSVRVGGFPVPGPEAAACRVLIPQEAYVHTGTLAENLGQFRPDPVPEAELLAAAGAVGSLPLVESLGGPRATVDPAALSAGERQLLALTRAYLSHAPLALLDEATCHLDPEAEAQAERAFAQRPGGTLVVVAHRMSSARRADRVLVMDGRETAYGTHDELMRSSVLYRDLVGSWTPVASEPALPLRDADRVDAVAGPGLAGDGRHVVAHRPVGQVQAPRDLRDGGPLGGQG